MPRAQSMKLGRRSDEYQTKVRGRVGALVGNCGTWPGGRMGDRGLVNSGRIHVAYGLMDTAGNVFEWTETAFGEGNAVVKGCSWDDEGGICRAASRHRRAKTARHILFGFRCVCEVSREDGG